MKSKLTKIWGVGLTLVLMVSLLVIAAPASAADPLQWNSEVLPSGTNQIMVEGLDILDFAISGDGLTIYAVGKTTSDNNVIYKSVNAGRTWVDISAETGFPTSSNSTTQFVAIAPDNSNIVAVAGTGIATSTTVPFIYITTGGSVWSSLGTIEDEGATNDAIAIYDLAISSEVPPGIRYVTCAGTFGTSGSNEARVYYYDLGAAAGDWRDAAIDFTGTTLTLTNRDAFYAIEFSPNFSADYTAVALCEVNETTTTKGKLELHALSFNLKRWNDFDSYPVTVQEAAAANTTFSVQAADVSLAPDYVGSDDISRVAFVGAALTDVSTEVGGIFRCDDQTPYDLKLGAPIYSVDFNGTDIVAGAYDTNYVWRSADPLVTQPTVIPSRSNKRIGVDWNTTTGKDSVIVAFNGDEVLGAKQGDASAFSVSRDNGNTWNDISLIDGALTDINDVWSTPDGSMLYFASDDSGETSVFRYSAGVWERILVLDATPSDNYILRGAPGDNDGLYVAAYQGTDIYYTADAGENRWYTRSAPAAIDEMVAESADVCYIGIDTTIRKSVNSGFTWSSPIAPELQGDNVVSMTSLGEDKLIIGGATGFISYTSDGADTWVKLDKPITTPATNRVQVTASGLETGDYIYASGSAAAEKAWRWTVGDSPAYDWLNMGAAPGSSDSAVGIALVENVLYVSYVDTTANTTTVQRCIGADGPRGSHEWSALADSAMLGSNPTQALRASTGASMKLWYVNNYSTNSIRSYIDTLATVSPEISSPADAFMNPMNPVTGRSVDVSFTWPRPSTSVTAYDIDICTDAACLNQVTRHTFTAPGPSALILMGPYQTLTQSVEFVSGMTYYWRARAQLPIYSAWSPVRTLVIQAGAASVPSIGAPINGASITNTSPAFSWSPVVGATKYEFQLSADAGFALPLLASTKLVSTGIQPAVTLDAGVTYFWRVRSLEPQEGSWSTIANFTVAVPVEPAAPVVIPPAPAPVVNIPPIEVPAPIVNIPPAPAPAAPISQGLLLAIIIIGAILVIAVIVLIVRTRRAV